MHLCRTVSKLIRHYSKLPPYNVISSMCFHIALHQITEDTEHASLEYGRGITQAKGHSPVGICVKWAGKGGFVLVSCSNFKLKIV